MTLEQSIQAERKQVQEKIDELKSQNDIDLKSLNALKEDYHNALFSSDEKEIDYVNSQIKEVSSRIARRNEKIEALQDKNNPVIQNMVSEQLKQWLHEIPNVEKQANKKAEDLKKLRAEFLKGLIELNDLIKQSNHFKYHINHYRKYLSEVNIRKAGIPEYQVDSWIWGNKIRALLINEREVFK